MKTHLATSELYIPDGAPEAEALARTTHLCVSAHQDDIEIMAAQPILECFQQTDKWFTGVVVTDGRGSPRNDMYESYTDDEMRIVRLKEQKKAAFVGEYAAQFFLDHPSSAVKDQANTGPVEDMKNILLATRPEMVFTHNLADKHDTHVSVTLRVIQAIRALAPQNRPRQLIGCEVWRSLDWLVDTDKLVLDVSGHENLQNALLGVFDSQIIGGKRYDLASMGRRRANATYYESHGVDVTTGLQYAMDLTPLITNLDLEPDKYIQGFIDHLQQDIAGRLTRLK
jgi:LmbE family N-acetylglucosaminyl deacetylase